MKTKQLLAMSRSFSHTNLMYQRLKETDNDVPVNEFNHYFITPHGTFFLLWLSLLYNVCLTMQSMNAIPDTIKDDLNEVMCDLKLCRNVTLHPPPNYFDDRFDIILKPERWLIIERVHHGLSQYFDAELAKVPPIDHFAPHNQ